MKKFIIGFFVALCTLPAFSLETYKAKATCSYYAEKFHGKKTANGERFNMYDLTCAHKSLPFNTVLKITNLANGKSVNVRVNDRGPFVAGREVDLSKGAAVKLDMIKTGTASCKIEIVKMGANTKQSAISAAKAQKIPLTPSKGSAASQAKISVKANELYDIQLASFSEKENAAEFAKSLMKEDFKNVVIQKTSSTNRVAIRQVYGKDVPAIVKKLKAKGHTNYVIKKR